MHGEIHNHKPYSLKFACLLLLNPAQVLGQFQQQRTAADGIGYLQNFCKFSSFFKILDEIVTHINKFYNVTPTPCSWSNYLEHNLNAIIWVKATKWSSLYFGALLN